MRVLFLLLLLSFSVNAEYQPNEMIGPQVQLVASSSSFSNSYVLVYGRKSCGNTTRMVEHLKKAGIPIRFYSVDDKKVAESLHQRMRETGVNTRNYYLPVIEIDKRFAINPDPQAISRFYLNK